nr:SMC5-SMC6 complex localization factor protein 1-like isoform X1 [Halyomorpha halys]
MKFPFFGVHCNRFAEELSAYVKIGNIIDEGTVFNIQLLHPYWLKFKVIGSILKSELTSNGVDDLDSVMKIMKRNLSLRPKPVLKSANEGGISKKNFNLKNNKCDTSGETVIHKYCRMNNHKALSAALRSKEVNVNIADNAGWTPLHNAAHYNSIDCFKLLIKHRLTAPAEADKLNIFSLNSDNDTPLSCAVKQGNDKIVDILLNSGAGVTVWNKVSSGCSAIQLAKTKQMEETLIKGWETSTSLYRHLNLAPLEIDLIYHMITSYCKLYHVSEYPMTLDLKLSKPDSYYNFDYIQYCKDENTLVALCELVEKLSTSRSNPKNLKRILFYLKCIIN